MKIFLTIFLPLLRRIVSSRALQCSFQAFALVVVGVGLAWECAESSQRFLGKAAQTSSRPSAHLFPRIVYSSLLNGESMPALEVFDIAGRRCVEPQALAESLGGVVRSDGCVQSLIVGEYAITFAADACVVAIERAGVFVALAQMPRPVSVQFQRLYAPLDNVLQIFADYGVAEAEETDEGIRWNAAFAPNATAAIGSASPPLSEQKDKKEQTNTQAKEQINERQSAEQTIPAAKPFKKPTRNLYIIPPGIQRREMDSLPEKSSLHRVPPFPSGNSPVALRSFALLGAASLKYAVASAVSRASTTARDVSTPLAEALEANAVALEANAVEANAVVMQSSPAQEKPKPAVKPAPQQPTKPVAKPASSQTPPVKAPAQQQPAASKKWALDVIVLDAGHGGKDAGTVGVGGTKEKDVTLGVVKKLGALLEEELPGTKIVYTRSNDAFVELDRRGQIANESGGKLFISIHCNSTPKKPSDANGFEVYILRPGRNEDAVRVAEMENSVIALEKDPKRYQALTEEQFIVVSMAQSAFVKYSDMAAAMITAEVKKIKELGVRGVNQAGFLVLVGASMPNMLIEIGFLSNKKEEQFLKSYRGQMLIARAIARAVKAYRVRYEAQIRAQTPAPPAAHSATKPVKK